MPAMMPGPSRKVHCAHGDERLAGDAQRVRLRAGGAGEVGLQRDDGQHAHDADEDHRASTTRSVTKPMAAVRLTRRVTGYSATAVPMPASGGDDLQQRTPEHGGVAARPC